MSFWNPDIEKLSSRGIAELQGRKLRAMVRHRLFRFHPFYHEMFKREGLHFHDIAGTEDLARLPFTTQSDLCKAPESFILSRSEKARKGPLSIPARMRFLFYDTIIGNPRIKLADEYDPVMAFDTLEHKCPVYLTGYDIELFKELCGRGAMCAGLVQHDSLLNVHPYGQRLDFWQAHYAALMLRSFTSRMGQEGPLDVIKTARRLGTTAITGNAYYLYYFARAAAATNADLRKLRTVVMTGYGGCDMKKKLESKFEQAGMAPRIIGTYSVTESRQSFPECPGGHGFHTYPDVHVWECIDPKTGECVGPGERGELVFSSIDGRGTTLLRYRTGDIAEGGIVQEPCEACGRTAPRIVGPIAKAPGARTIEIKDMSKKLLDVDGLLFAYVRHKGDRISVTGALDGTSGEDKVREHIIAFCGEKVAIKLDK